MLIEDCWNPELDACRALVVRGLAGRLEVWRAGTTYPGLIIPDIGAAAFRTVKESEKMGPRFGPWTPHPEDRGSDAISRSPVFAPAAVSQAGGERPYPDEIERPANTPLQRRDGRIDDPLPPADFAGQNLVRSPHCTGGPRVAAYNSAPSTSPGGSPAETVDLRPGVLLQGRRQLLLATRFWRGPR